MHLADFRKLLSFAFLVGLVVFGVISYQVLVKQAQNNVVSKVEMMMNFADAVRAYTAEEVRPEMQSHRGTTPLSHAVPSYAAIKVLERLSEKYSDYQYREVARNPTNPENKANAWEAELLDRLSGSDSLDEVVGEKRINNEEFIYVARSVRMKQKACLSCHGRPEDAPARMIKVYGTENGFNWKPNGVVAAQIGLVPKSKIDSQLTKSFIAYMFVVAFFLLIVLILTDQVLHTNVRRNRP